MYIKLKWTNLNSGSFTTNIYRSTSPIDRANLGTPLATLTAGESEYQDDVVVRGTTYYYVFETLNAGDRSVSINYAFKAVPRRGAGPNDIVVGDYEYGYFGTLISADFIGTAELMAKVGLTGATIVNAAPLWHKYARKGKVLFVPSKGLASGVAWSALYNAGIVYGVDANNKGGQYVPTPGVNQLRKITIGSDQYIVRLTTGYSDNPLDTVPNISASEPTDEFLNEWDDLIYPLHVTTPNKQRMVNIAAMSTSDMGLTGQYSVWVQELAAVTLAAARGANNTGRTGVANRQCFGVTSNGSAQTWWPVLELVEG